MSASTADGDLRGGETLKRIAPLFPPSRSRPFGPPEEYEKSGLTGDRSQWCTRHFQSSRKEMLHDREQNVQMPEVQEACCLC